MVDPSVPLAPEDEAPLDDDAPLDEDEAPLEDAEEDDEVDDELAPASLGSGIGSASVPHATAIATRAKGARTTGPNERRGRLPCILQR